MKNLLALWCLALPLTASVATAQPVAPNTWRKLDQATIVGRRADVPFSYAPDLKRFLILGGRSSFADYRKPRSFDQLALDLPAGRWENWLPPGKNWGPLVGPVEAPAWKTEYFQLGDSAGNPRPNWTVYGTFSLGQKYDYDSDSKSYLFYMGGHTLRYDPATRQWSDRAPPNHPEKELGGTLLWSSLVYDRHHKRFVLFGGGNVQTQRGDPGTWIYDPTADTWTQLPLKHQPPPRANSRLAYDPVAKKIVLFGGDQLHQLLADTWILDVVTGQWEQRQPARGPAPRAGHALLWLPKAKKILLLGGYEYTSAVGYVESLYRPLPLEAWTYDVAANRWELVRRWDSVKDAPSNPQNGFLAAAVDEGDTVAVLDGKANTWLCPCAATKPDAAGTEKYGVAPGAIARRTGPHDPAWYREGVPAPEPEKVAADLKNLPANRWVLRPTPKLPRPNMDWGSAVFAPELDKILRLSGGHSAYSGTAPQVYDVKTDRYTIPFAPEYPLEYVYSNDQVRGEWSFGGNPWMTGHTYRSTGYDPHLKALVFAPHQYTYFFDPLMGKWSRGPERNPYLADFYNVNVCATPRGAVVWAARPKGVPGFWRLDAASRTWKELSLQGTLPNRSPDRHGMAYDSKRDRLLLFSDVGKQAGDVCAYDLKTGQAKWLNAVGRAQAAVHCREAVYLPEVDAVLIGARIQGDDGVWRWALYDCGKNAWYAVELGGANPITKGSFNNSLGLMVDPQRRLVWAVGQNSHVQVLRLDLSTAELRALK